MALADTLWLMKPEAPELATFADLTRRPEWMSKGSCHQTDTTSYFPERGQDIRPAKAVCATCPVAAECLAYAMADMTIVGVWGGTSHVERIKLSRSGSDSCVNTACSSDDYV